MMKNFALIGCGYWGTIIINTLNKINKFEYIHICDEDWKFCKDYTNKGANKK